MYTFQYKLILPMYAECLNTKPRHSSATLFLWAARTYQKFKSVDMLLIVTAFAT